MFTQRNDPSSRQHRERLVQGRFLLQPGSLLAVGLLVGFSMQGFSLPQQDSPIGPVRASAFILVSERGTPLAELRSEHGATELIFWPVGDASSESRASLSIRDGLARFELSSGGGQSRIEAQCFGSNANLQCSGADKSDKKAVTIASIHSLPFTAEISVSNPSYSPAIARGSENLPVMPVMPVMGSVSVVESAQSFASSFAASSLPLRRHDWTHRSR